MSPKDAGMEALKRIRAATVERRLLNTRGEPNFNVSFYVLNARGEPSVLPKRRPAVQVTRSRSIFMRRPLP